MNGGETFHTCLAETNTFHSEISMHQLHWRMRSHFDTAPHPSACGPGSVGHRGVL